MKMNTGLSFVTSGMCGFILLLAGIWYPGGGSMTALAQSQPQRQETVQTNTGSQGSSEAGQEASQSNVDAKSTLYGIDVQEYIRKKYAVAGPNTVKAVTAARLDLFTGLERDLVFNLSGKKVKVMDTSGNEIAFGSIQKNSRVLVLTKANEVLIYVLPAKKERKDA